jgi:hypothetical protein
LWYSFDRPQLADLPYSNLPLDSTIIDCRSGGTLNYTLKNKKREIHGALLLWTTLGFWPFPSPRHPAPSLLLVNWMLVPTSNPWRRIALLLLPTMGLLVLQELAKASSLKVRYRSWVLGLSPSLSRFIFTFRFFFFEVGLCWLILWPFVASYWLLRGPPSLLIFFAILFFWAFWLNREGASPPLLPRRDIWFLHVVVGLLAPAFLALYLFFFKPRWGFKSSS